MQVSAGSQLGGDKTPFSSSYSTNSTKEEQCRQGTDRQCKGSTEQRALHARERQGVSREASWKRGVKRSPGGPERWSWRGGMPKPRDSGVRGLQKGCSPVRMDLNVKG